MTEADIVAAAAVQAEATRSDQATYVRCYYEGLRWTWRDGWVVEDNGEISAAAIAMPVRWWLHGVAYTVSAISEVAVRAVDRRRGFATQLLGAILRADQSEGQLGSILYPFQHGFYRRFGYATVGFTHYYRIPTVNITDDARLRRCVRVLRDSDRIVLPDLYQQSLQTGIGGLERSAGQWTARWPNHDERWIVYDDDDIQGYLVYELGPEGLHVRELVTRSADAARGLWAFLAAQGEQSRIIMYHAPTQIPVWSMLREPLMANGQNRGAALNDVAALTAGLMARLITIPTAFAQRPIPAAATGAFVLALHDPLLITNTTTFSMTFSDGHIEVAPTDAAPMATCDVVTLTQIFCGVLRAGAARWYGRLTADDDVIGLLDQMFIDATPFIHSADWF